METTEEIVTPKEIKQDFINFLKTRRLYSAFQRNFVNYRLSPPSDKPFSFIKKNALIYPETMIERAFIWHITPKGINFWGDISKEWKEFYIKHYKNI